MVQTTISSATRSITFGKGLPTVIIGERINPSCRRKFGQSLLAGDLTLVVEEAVRQVEAGAEALDVNVGYAGVDEISLLPEAVKAVAGAVDVPLVIDSSFPEALEAALEVYKGKPLINSVTGEEKSMERILPLVARYKAAVIGLCMDDSGCPTGLAERVAIAEKILQRAAAYGIPKEDVVIDCLTMTVSTDHQAAKVTLDTVTRVSEGLGVNVVLGASNVSHGLPDRRVINHAFYALAVAAGATALIVDPVSPGVRRIIRAADLLLGRDEWAMNYIHDFRTFGAA